MPAPARYGRLKTAQFATGERGADAEPERADVWQSWGVEKVEKPLMGVALVFCIVMAIAGWLTIAYAGWVAGLVITGILGTLALAGAGWGWRRQSPYWVGAGAVGTGVLFPTLAGVVPMILGAILMILLSTLRLFNQMTQGQ
ncbi:hypothetical protein [Trueperella pyogenes]|uniref:hypothetical protein n=1 Tax=Trueperella pyogenes TaxID=1661 RepID=UPI000B30A864|nr:hypothetical protein [Trueperella pyogenes]